MPYTFNISAEAANAEADAFARKLDGGYLDLYTGTQPADVSVAITAQIKVVRLPFANPSAPAAVDGVITITLPIQANAIATGDIAWGRAVKSDGVTGVFDGAAGLSGCDITVTKVDAMINDQVQVTSITAIAPKV